MKKLIHILPAIMISASIAGNVAGAQAPQDCDVLIINDTGPGSTTQVVCNVTTDVQVDCKNNVYILNENSQTAVSGDASSQGNVTNNTTITGNAVNSNGDVVRIGASCELETTEGPGQGSTSPPSTGRGAFTPAQLPNTSDNHLSPFTIASLAGTSAAATLLAAILASWLGRFGGK